MTLPLLLALVGCKMAVDGEVLDVVGQPIPGATVTLVSVERSQCQTVTDAAGAFELACPTGVYDLHIGAEGYLDHITEDFDASERKRHDVGRQTLIKLPTEEGLLRFDEGSYVAMPRARLERRKGGAGVDQWKHYCLPEEVPEGQITRLPPGNHAFFDNESVGWRPWRLDEEGCAYRMAPRDEKSWETTYAEKANYIEEKVAQGKKLVLMELPAGRYFIADWDNGFFTKGTVDGEKGYVGHYLVVE